MTIEIVDATKNDALFVAKCVLASVQKYDFSSSIQVNSHLVDICKEDDTLFSYRNVRIALLDGIPVGALVSYSGKFYHEARNRTYLNYNPGSDMECMEDEYYLDSMAIKPEARGFQIGKLLMADAISKAVSLGFHKVSLIILDAEDHTGLKKYYSSLGFSEREKVMFFDLKYTRLVKNSLFRHYVMWKFKGTAEERKKSAMWMKEHLESLRGKIPGLVSIEVLVDTNAEQQFDAILIASFVSLEYFLSYKIHPLHLPISEYCRTIRENRVSFDVWGQM